MKQRLATLKETAIVPDFEQIIDDFIILKQNQGRSERTIEDYKYYIQRFYKRSSYFPDANLMKKAASEWLNVKISASAYNLRLTYNKAFFRYCVEQEYLTENPMERGPSTSKS